MSKICMNGQPHIKISQNISYLPVHMPPQPALLSTPKVEAEVSTSVEPEGEPLPTPVVAMPIVTWICF